MRHVIALLFALTFASLANAQQDSSSELVLVRNRTALATDALYRHLRFMPSDVLANAECIAVLSKDTIGWGLMGTEIGAGLVSCRLVQGGWSAPSYLALGGVSIGPNIGFLNEDTTFLLGRPAARNVLASSFRFDAGVYATGAQAHAEASATSDGCFTLDLIQHRQRHCTLAVTDMLGLHAGANVTAILTRHMHGFFGAGLAGRNARVYGSGTSLSSIMRMDVTRAPSVTTDWIETLNQLAP